LPGPRAWLLLAATLGAGSALSLLAPATLLDWQPALAWREPWRAFSAAWVHWSALHLGANAVGLALVAALGAVGRLRARWTLAWLVAWPLTQFGLLAEPGLLRYGGLSGVLHAGLAVAVVALWHDAEGAARRGQRALAAAIGLGLSVKLLLEVPGGSALRWEAGWDIAVAPFAHLSGAVAGALAAMAAIAIGGLTRERQPR
jgi:rhomboid family GlyGly-CTERM serine protease